MLGDKYLPQIFMSIQSNWAKELIYFDKNQTETIRTQNNEDSKIYLINVYKHVVTHIAILKSVVKLQIDPLSLKIGDYVQLASS